MALILENDLGHWKFIRKKKKSHVKFGMMHNANNGITNLLS